MKLSRLLLVQAGIFVIMAAYSLYMYTKMPDQVPTHWGIDGKPDGYGSKLTALGTTLFMMPFMMLLSWGLPKISPKNFRIESFENTWSYVMLLATLMMAAIHVLTVRASAGANFDIGNAIMAILFAFFVLLGNVMGKVRRNFWMGVRTPWTLASDQVWVSTHRLAGRTWVVGGIIGLVVSLAGAGVLIDLVLLLAMSFLPVVQSYFIYRKLEGNGTPL